MKTGGLTVRTTVPLWKTSTIFGEFCRFLSRFGPDSVPCPTVPFKLSARTRLQRKRPACNEPDRAKTSRADRVVGFRARLFAFHFHRTRDACAPVGGLSSRGVPVGRRRNELVEISCQRAGPLRYGRYGYSAICWIEKQHFSSPEHRSDKCLPPTAKTTGPQIVRAREHN
jgi:hypothetical protein